MALLLGPPGQDIPIGRAVGVAIVLGIVSAACFLGLRPNIGNAFVLVAFLANVLVVRWTIGLSFIRSCLLFTSHDIIAGVFVHFI